MSGSRVHRSVRPSRPSRPLRLVGCRLRATSPSAVRMGRRRGCKPRNRRLYRPLSAQRSLRLSVRTSGFQPEKRGSTPLGTASAEGGLFRADAPAGCFSILVLLTSQGIAVAMPIFAMSVQLGRVTRPVVLLLTGRDLGLYPAFALQSWAVPLGGGAPLGRVSRFKGAMLGRSMIAFSVPGTSVRRGGETPAKRHGAQGNDQNGSHGLASGFDRCLNSPWPRGPHGREMPSPGIPGYLRFLTSRSPDDRQSNGRAPAAESPVRLPSGRPREKSSAWTAKPVFFAFPGFT